VKGYDHSPAEYFPYSTETEPGIVILLSSPPTPLWEFSSSDLLLLFKLTSFLYAPHPVCLHRHDWVAFKARKNPSVRDA